MVGQGRYAAVVFPVYIVLGQLMFRLPSVVSRGFYCLSGFMLGAYSLLFAAWYRMI
jgi:hypothetical protein